MAANYGVNIKIGSKASRSFLVSSNTAIGAVVSIALEEGNTLKESLLTEPLKFYSSASLAYEEFSKYEGSVSSVLRGILEQNTKSPIILRFCCISLEQSQEKAESFYGEDEFKTEILNAMEDFKKSYALFGIKPNLLIAPYFSSDLDVGVKMQSIANSLSAMALIDLNVESESEAILKAKNYESKRVLLLDPYIKVWDTLKGKEAFEPSSARVAGLIAYVDGEEEYGFSNSFSNRILNGVSGTKRIVEFEAGENSEADRIRSCNITTIIRYKGFRVWGNNTTSLDSIWQDFSRVRVFDAIANSALDGLFWAIDKRADELKAAKDSLEAMLLSLKGAKVLVDYEVSWNEELNTPANITAGKFYLDVGVMNTPIVKRLEVSFDYTDKYASSLIKIIS